MKINEIKEKLQQLVVDEAFLLAIQKDERAGVQKLLQQYDRRQEQAEKERQRYKRMNVLEENFQKEGHVYVAGVDEVGRGPLAGPVVAAAVILEPSKPIIGLDDSKKLSEKKRLSLYEEIKEKAIAYGIGIASVEEIDEHNIYQATKMAMTRAIQELHPHPTALLLDAMTLDMDVPQQSIIKGDATSNCIAAASIVAKTYRDDLMKHYHEQFPHYAFHKNMGYGTKEHLEGLDAHGVTVIHRKTFEPIKSMLKK